jgi:hypothetical protein
MSLESELRKTSDSLLNVLNQLADLETQKRALPGGSPEFVTLSRRIADLSVEVLRRSEVEADLAESLEERRRAGLAQTKPIEAVAPAARDLQVILDEWRAAERQLAQADPAGIESADAAASVRRLRDEYRLAFEAARERARE